MRLITLLCLILSGVFGTSVVHAQFDPMRDGFGFENYGNDTMPVNLTGVELHRMFGNAVCASGSGPMCPLTPQAAQWMEQVSGKMSGGHCEGMAVLAVRFFERNSDPMMFGAPTPFMLTLPSNTDLQREIGFWWATQEFPEVASATIRGTPSSIVSTLRAALMRGGGGYIIGVSKRDRTGGHAVTPYNIVDVDATNVQIVIYDNNFPGQARTIDIDLSAETWRYASSTSPDVPSSLYDGDATTNTLELIPMAPRTGAACPFCGNFTSGMAANRTVSVTGDASLLVVDPSGRRVGHLPDGSQVNEISGADVISSRSADRWNDQSEPSYVIPGGMAFDVYLGDAGRAVADPSNLSITGPGYYLGVEDVMLDAGQEDIVSFEADTAYLGYETSGFETPDIVIAAQTVAADWVFVVRSRGDTAGQRIDASIDFETQTLNLGFTGADAESEFDLFAARVDAGTEIEFATEMVRVPNGAALSIYFGDYNVDGEGLVVSIDTNGDGTEDSTLPLADTGDIGIGPGPGGTPSVPPAANSGCSVTGGRTNGGMAPLLALGLILAVRRRTRGRG